MDIPGSARRWTWRPSPYPCEPAQARVRLDPGENFVAMIAADIRREIRGRENLRRPQVGRKWVIKALSHYTDHFAASAVNSDIFADYLGVGGKDTLPQSIAEDDNAIVALLPFVG